MSDVGSLFDRRIDMVGGVSALLLQFLHPEVARVLAQTGSMKRDPLGRLLRTGKLTGEVLLRDPDAISRFRLVHDRIDRRQMLWVYVTLVVPAIRARAMLHGAIGSKGAEALYNSARRFASDVGIPDDLLPQTYVALEEYYTSMLRGLDSADGELQMTGDAIEIARAIFAIRVKGVPIGWIIKTLGAGLLPDRVRSAYGLKWGISQRAFWRLVLFALKWREPKRLRVATT